MSLLYLKTGPLTVEINSDNFKNLKIIKILRFEKIKNGTRFLALALGIPKLWFVIRWDKSLEI